jgi:glycosyltransferase involved in cell wall biosynthesis
MSNEIQKKQVKLSIVIPCYNEEKTLRKCVKRVIDIADEELAVEIIVVDDCSTDQSYKVATQLEKEHEDVVIIRHQKNLGKGAALRTGFKKVSGDFVSIQDADLEYDPKDLKRLLAPLKNGEADVVLGSRFLSSGTHRVLYYWHYVGNRILTILSNMFTDLNITDMETCYKVFRREIIQGIDIKEDRFGFEPEIVAKIAHMRLRVYEMGVSYYGRTYEEGKKIGAKDGIRALYCILRYNANKSPLPMQFLLYLGIGGLAAIVNLVFFLALYHSGVSILLAAPVAFVAAAAVNYFLCILILFRHKARWNSGKEIAIFFLIVATVGCLDLVIAKGLLSAGFSPAISKLIATGVGLVLNFSGRRFIVFPEPGSGPWKPQERSISKE